MARKTTKLSAEDHGQGSGEPLQPDPVPDQPETIGPPESPKRPSGAWVELIERRSSDPSDEDIQAIVNKQVEEVLTRHAATQRYRVLFLHDPTLMARSDADRIYRAVTSSSSDAPILLIIDSLGGSISAAYFIAKLCREYSPKGFDVAVPRRAKSAATLICCGADRIHMGSLSELGPLDPQFEDVPALALKNSIEHLAELSKRYPHAAEMFASYMAKSLKIEDLGYYERVAESAAQYAERLLKNRRTESVADPASIAHHLVYAYKDHGFVIDANEAAEIFGTSVVQVNTDEYALANEVYRALDLISHILQDFYNRGFYFTGGPDNGCVLTKGRA